MIARILDWLGTLADGRRDGYAVAPHAARYAPWDDPSRGGWRREV